MHTRHLVIAFTMLRGTSSGFAGTEAVEVTDTAAVETHLDVAARSVITQYSNDMFCEKDDPGLTVSTDATARFTVLKTGHLRIDLHAPARTIAFESEKPIAKIQTIASSAGDPKTIACGNGKPGAIYEIPGDEKVVTVSVFADVDHDATYLADYRAKALSQLRQNERDALHAIPELQRFVTTARVAILQPATSALASARAAAAKAKTALTSSQACDAPDESLQPAICDEILSLTTSIDALDSVLAQAASKPDDERPKLIANAKPLDLLSTLKPTDPVPESAGKAQCERIARYRWLDRKSVPRLLTVASLPLVTELTVGAYGEKLAPIDEVSADEERGLLVTGIPYSQKIKFAEVQGDRVTLTVPVLFTAIVGQGRSQIFGPMANAKVALAKMAMNGGGDGANAGFKSLIDDLGAQKSDQATLQKLVDKLTTNVFESLTNDTPASSVLCTPALARDVPPIKFDDGLPASSNVEHRGFVFKLDRDHKKSVSLCSGAECTGKDDDKELKTRLTLTPSRARSFTLLAEVSGAVKQTYAELSAPEFKPVLGNDGPDQVYEMQQTANPADAISTSLLLALHVSHNTMLAIGPSLTTGTSGNAFKQWNGRLARHLGDSGLVISAGISVRAVPLPEDYAIGDRVSVPRTMSTKPPDVRTYYTADWHVEIGLAFDLSGISSLASDAYKAIGGK